MRSRTRQGDIRSEAGFAMVSALLVMLLLATLAGASLINTGVDLQSASHFKTARQAFFAAESGLFHALGTINARGVQNFSEDIVDTTNWSRLYGPLTKSLISDPGTLYSVSVAADAADPWNRGTITAIGTSDQEARRALRIALRKGQMVGPGALYLANDLVDPDFGARDQFLIDGTDHNLDGTINAANPLKPGISTRNDAVTDASIAELSDPQKTRVRGLGFSLDPLNPSVWTTDGPSVTDLDQIIDRILSTQPVVEVNDHVLASGTYGTPAAPQVTRLTSKTVKLDGQMEGAGILIAEGSFTINGSANFIGWVIIRGETILNTKQVDDTLVAGNATILGSLWTGDLVVQVGGSAIIEYCDACMALADGIGTGNNVPRAMVVTSWQEIY
jgi:hypothetical protein